MASWDDDDDYDDYEQEPQEFDPSQVIFQARCIYAFDSTCDVELSIQEGDVVNVTSDNVGGGWWEGELNGQVGLFPEQYVEKMDSGMPSGPPPTNWGDEMDPGETGTYDNVTSTSEPAQPPPARTLHRGGASILEGFQWTPNDQHVEITVAVNSKKEKKFSGMKSYTTYRLTNTGSDAVVNHRFKHFDWLHARLTEMYPCVCVPALPGKQVAGRFGDEFIEQRRRKLEKFLNRVARHPILGGSSVFRHFLTVSDQKAWKTGKREAEAEASSNTFLATLNVLDTVPGNGSDTVTLHSRFHGWLEKQFTLLIADYEEILKTEKIESNLVTKLGKCFQKSGDPDTYKESDRPNYELWWSEGKGNNLKAILDAVGTVGEGLDQLSALISSQYDQDIEGFAAFLQEYQSLLRSMALVTKAHDAAWHALATAKQKETSPEVVADLEAKCKIATALAMAEFRHFHECAVLDLKHAFSELCQQQASYHRRAAEIWDSLGMTIEQSL